MKHIIAAYIGIPYGAVWSNLIASGICVGAAYLRLRTRAAAHHLEQIEHQKRLHEQLKAHLGVGGGEVAGGDDH